MSYDGTHRKKGTQIRQWAVGRLEQLEREKAEAIAKLEGVGEDLEALDARLAEIAEGVTVPEVLEEIEQMRAEIAQTMKGERR